MVVNHKITQYYSNFRGLNLSVNDIKRDPSEATAAENLVIRDDGSIVKRHGYKYQNTAGSYGIMNFPKTNTATGIVTEELLLIDSGLQRQKKGTITLTNSIGNGQPVSIDVEGDATTNNFVVTITFVALIDDLGDITVPETSSSINLGDITATLSAKTVAELITDLNNISGLSAAADAGSDTSVSAVSLNLTSVLQISDGNTGDLTFHYEETITADTAATLTLGLAAYKTSDNGEHLSKTLFNRSAYFTNGFDDLMQYDGHTFFRAGMTQHALPTGATGAAGALTGNYTYIVQSSFQDRNGLIHNGAFSEASATIAPSSQKIDLTVNNIEDGNAFDARGALADGGQSNSPVSGSVTLTVDNNTVIVDDVIFLFNTDSSTYAEYTVTAVTATTIIVTSAVDIDLDNNSVISTGIRHTIYRTKAGGTKYFFVATIPNNYTAATQTYTDNAADSTLTSAQIIAIRVGGLPPKARYVSAYRNILTLGNRPTNPNLLDFSEPDQPTNFPSLNNVLVVAESGGVISGIANSNEALIVFSKNSEAIHTITGDLVTGRIRVDLLSSSIGCTSHSSIVDINGVLFFLSEQGVYSMVGAGVPQLVSREINKLIAKKSNLETLKLRKNRAIAVHNEFNKEYILMIPTEDELANNKFATDDSLIIVLDYFNNNWTTWTNLNLANGATTFEDTLLWSSREQDLAQTSVVSYIYRQHDSGDSSDYGDQTNAIPLRYASGWESLKNPSNNKKFLRIKIHSITESEDEIVVEDFILTGSTELNFNYNRPHSNFTLDFPDRGVPWDSKPWDTFTWGGFQQTSARVKLRSGKAFSLRLILENEEYNKNVVITGWEAEIAAPQRATIKE